MCAVIKAVWKLSAVNIERQVIKAGIKEKKGWCKDECSPRT